MGNNFSDTDSLVKVYEGSEPYIFISYAHKDSDRVLPVIEFLQKEGFRVWFDAGIEVGTEWPEYIAEHLYNCECAIAFVSRNFAKSRHCVKELRFAVSKEKNIFAVYLEDFEMSLGMQMQLEDVQAMFSYRHKTKESFMKTLAASRIIQPCRALSEAVTERNTEPVNVENSKTAIAVDKEAEKAEPEFERKTKKKTAVKENTEKANEAKAERKLIDSGKDFLVCDGRFVRNEWFLFDDGELLLKAKGPIRDYNSIIPENEIPWYKHRKKIRSVVISEGITSIGRSSFYNCEYLETVKISSTVTAIGDEAFRNCKRLKNIKSDAKIISIGTAAFKECQSLEKFALSEGLEIISKETFYGCNNIKVITIPESVKMIDRYAFWSCDNLVCVTVLNPDLNIIPARFPKKTLIVAHAGSESEKFAKIRKYAFEPLLSEYSETIAEPLNECVEEGNCGNNCTYKRYSNGDLIISGYGDMDNYKSYLSKPWRNKAGLVKRVVVENGITSIGSFAFCAMENVKEITIPDSVKVINEGGISNLLSLEEITLPSTVEAIDFHLMCEGLKMITIGNSELDISELEFEGDTVIVAPEGSLAEKYAKEHSLSFKTI